MRTKLLFAGIILSLFLSGGCSVVDLDNNLKQWKDTAQNGFDTVLMPENNTNSMDVVGQEETSTLTSDMDSDSVPYRKINPDAYEHNKMDLVWHEMGEAILFSSEYRDTEYTVERAQLFPDIRSAGLSQKDIDFVLERTKNGITNPLVLLTVRVKPLRQGHSSVEEFADGHYSIGVFALAEKQAVVEDRDIFAPEIVYFDHHGDDSKDEYGDYWIKEGEECVFQIGILLNDEIDPEEELVLKVREYNAEKKDHVVEIGSLSYENI